GRRGRVQVQMVVVQAREEGAAAGVHDRQAGVREVGCDRGDGAGTDPHIAAPPGSYFGVPNQQIGHRRRTPNSASTAVVCCPAVGATPIGARRDGARTAASSTGTVVDTGASVAATTADIEISQSRPDPSAGADIASTAAVTPVSGSAIASPTN